MGGYSSKSLVEKLGLKENEKVLLLNEPSNYPDLLKDLPKGVTFSTHPGGKFHFIHFFAKNEKEVEKMFPFLKSLLDYEGSLWVSWPKKTSSIPSELSENVVRDIGLKNGLVDIKIVAIDEDWSGLKFVFRLTDRV